jgi:hypothetical protein
MPEFDLSKLSSSELAAYWARVECDGTAETDALFASIVQKATALQAEGWGPKEIVVTVVGDYFDLEPLTMRGPIIRYETIVLVKPMVEQVVELSGVDGSNLAVIPGRAKELGKGEPRGT